MEFVVDWRFWLFALNVVILVFNFLSHQKIVHNDLHHLALDTKEIKEEQRKHSEQISDIESDISFIKGQADANNKIVKILEKVLDN